MRCVLRVKMFHSQSDIFQACVAHIFSYTIIIAKIYQAHSVAYMVQAHKENIAFERTVSQICDIGATSFSLKTRKKIIKTNGSSIPDQKTIFIPISHIAKSRTYKSIFGNTQTKNQLSVSKLTCHSIESSSRYH